MAKSFKRASDSVERAAYTLADWCAAHGIALSTFYALPPEDKPAMIRLGKRRILITVQADEAWRKRMEERGV